MASILVIATAHAFQKVGNPSEKLFRGVLASVTRRNGIQIILEEWNGKNETAIAYGLKTTQLEWENVGTPALPEYNTAVGYINNDPYDSQQPKHEYFHEYPLYIHERREHFMVERIVKVMSRYEKGLFIVGMAHLHSMMIKLRVAGFDVTGGSWLPNLAMLGTD